MSLWTRTFRSSFQSNPLALSLSPSCFFFFNFTEKTRASSSVRLDGFFESNAEVIWYHYKGLQLVTMKNRLLYFERETRRADLTHLFLSIFLSFSAALEIIVTMYVSWSPNARFPATIFSFGAFRTRQVFEESVPYVFQFLFQRVLFVCIFCCRYIF